MKRSERLQAIIRLVAHHELSVARQLGLCQHQLADSRRRLAELLDYRAEYQQQFGERASRNGFRLGDFRAFFDKLDLAIAQQRRVVENATRQWEESRRQWLSVHRRHETLSNAAERMSMEERQEERRREQKSADDQSLRRRPAGATVFPRK